MFEELWDGALCLACHRVCDKLRFSVTQRAKPATKRKCVQCVQCVVRPASKHGPCVYCGAVGPLTKEHLVPKCAGGTLTVRACRSCNQTRGSSGTWPPFLAYISAHPAQWRQATRDCNGVLSVALWLYDNDLIHAA